MVPKSVVLALETLLAGLLTRLFRLLKCVQFKQEVFARQNRLITRVVVMWVAVMPY